MLSFSRETDSRLAIFSEDSSRNDPHLERAELFRIDFVKRKQKYSSIHV
jgi:hypothetical protein